MSKLIIFGDSISAGAWDTAGGWAARLISFLNSRTIEEENFYCMAYNLGISGDCLPDVTSRVVREIDVRHNQEDSLVIILAVGVNDSQYLVDEKKLRFTPQSFSNELIKFSKLLGRYSYKLLVVGPAPVDESLVDPMPWATDRAYRNKHISTFNEQLINWSSENEYPFINLFTEWLELSYKSYLCDGIHPNSEGHRIIYERVLEEFERFNLFNEFTS